MNENVTPHGIHFIKRHFRVVAMLCALFSSTFNLSGCLGSLSNVPAPDYFQIDYPFQSSKCVEPFPGTLRVWPFSASTPFDHEQMFVTSPSLRVRFSSHYKWVSSAGDMITSHLMRDLSIGNIFQSIIPAGDPMPAAYGMSGQVYRFALEEGSSSRVLLEIEISFWREKPHAILFRKYFHYQSPPLTSTDPGEFAAAMSDLVSQLSTDLRNDLCTITQDSLHQAAD